MTKVRAMRFAFLLFFVVACENQKGEGAPPPQAVQADPAREAFVEKYFRIFNQHDWRALAALYAPNAEFRDPSLGPKVVKQSQEDFIKKYGELAAAFPDVSDRVVAVYTSGPQHVVVEFVSTGTAPDGTKFELPICTIFELSGGLIVKDYTYYDNSKG